MNSIIILPVYDENKTIKALYTEGHVDKELFTQAIWEYGGLSVDPAKCQHVHAKTNPAFTLVFSGSKGSLPCTFIDLLD